MPNWVFNTISCKDQITFDKIRKLTKGTDAQGNESEFTYNVLIPTPDYINQNDLSGDEMTNPACWYMWNCTHWGCKWDASHIKIDNCEKMITFESPWSPPDQFFNKLIEEIGKIGNFTIYYEEEQGWGAEIIIEHGMIVKRTDYERVPGYYGDDDPGWIEGEENTYDPPEDE